MNVIVLGNGRSGKAAAELLFREGCRVQILDGDDPWPEGDWDLCVTSPGVPLDHPWQQAARSAGVKVISELQLGAERYKALGGRMLAVTGSKGKSSVVKLVADALDGIPCGNYGKPLCEVVLDAINGVGNGKSGVESAFNPGRDPADLGRDPAETCADLGRDPCRGLKNIRKNPENYNYRSRLPFAVVEVSSFQMETTDLPADTFEAAAILNLQEDHLDRHGSIEVYHLLKRKLLNSAQVKIEGSLGGGVLKVESGKSRSDFRSMGTDPLGEMGTDPIGAKEEMGIEEMGIDPLEEMGIDPLKSDKKHSDVELFEGSYFDNPVLRDNGRCAVALMQAAGLGDEAVKAAFRRFEPLPHRMQTVGEFAGVTYIDDSKATSISALIAGVIMAISRFSPLLHSNFSDFTGSLPSSPGSLPSSQLSTLNSQLNHVRLIAGGLPKGDDPRTAREVLSGGVAKVYLIGQCAEAFEAAWKDVVPCEVCGDIETAVLRAKKEASKGDCVLLSPGTASFDQFKSYGDRGDRFACLAGYL